MGTDNNSVIQWLSDNGLANFLPVSPVQKYLLSWDGLLVIQDYLSYLNWFLPISWCIDVMLAWLMAIGMFYLVQWFLRTFNVIGS